MPLSFPHVFYQQVPAIKWPLLKIYSKHHYNLSENQPILSFVWYLLLNNIAVLRLTLESFNYRGFNISKKKFIAMSSL